MYFPLALTLQRPTVFIPSAVFVSSCSLTDRQTDSSPLALFLARYVGGGLEGSRTYGEGQFDVQRRRKEEGYEN